MSIYLKGALLTENFHMKKDMISYVNLNRYLNRKGAWKMIYEDVALYKKECRITIEQSKIRCDHYLKVHKL